jgi:repressor of nif and glnA expression
VPTFKKKTETSQMNNVMMHLKLLEKQEQTKPKTSRQREIIKIGAKISEFKTKQTIQRIDETESWFFQKITRLTNPLPT